MKKLLLYTALAACSLALPFTMACGASASTGSAHTVTATWAGPAQNNAMVTITDDDMFGKHNVTYATYYMNDGYSKKITLGSGVPLKAVDLGNCHRAGYPDGLTFQCSSKLSATEQFPPASSISGSLAGGTFNAGIHATQAATGSGDYLITGEINHGAMTKIIYGDTAGDTFTINFPLKNALIFRVLINSGGTGYSAVISPYTQ